MWCARKAAMIIQLKSDGVFYIESNPHPPLPPSRIIDTVIRVSRGPLYDLANKDFGFIRNNKLLLLLRCSPLVAWLLIGVGLGACRLEGCRGGESELSLYESSSPRLPSSLSGLRGAEQGSLLSHASLLLLLLLPCLDRQCCCKISPPADACWQSSPAMDSMPWMASSVLGEVGHSLWETSFIF